MTLDILRQEYASTAKRLSKFRTLAANYRTYSMDLDRMDQQSEDRREYMDSDNYLSKKRRTQLKHYGTGLATILTMNNLGSDTKRE
jgi:hypothetical protein